MKGRYNMQNNKLPTRIPVESKDNSNFHEKQGQLVMARNKKACIPVWCTLQTQLEWLMQPSQQVCLLSWLPLLCLSEQSIKLSPNTCIANIKRVDESSCSFALPCLYHLAIHAQLGHSDMKTDLSSTSTWLLVKSWLFCIHQHLPCSIRFWCMLGGIVKV